VKTKMIEVHERIGHGWAWMFGDGSLCHWVEPERAILSRAAKPSPEAKLVRVAIVRVVSQRKKARRG